ncbi:MAG: transcription termination factor NusA, partial [Intestinibacillus sp.]
AAIDQLEKEKGIPADYMLDRVGQALLTAYKRDNAGMTDNVYVVPDREKKEIRMFVRKTVVDDVYEPYEELSLEEAREYKKNAMIGDVIDIDIPTKSFGRIAAQTAKQVIIQGIREAERGMVLSEFTSKEHEILTAVVSRIDPRNGAVILEITSQGEKTEAVLSSSEQVRGETLVEGQRVKVYVIEVRKGQRGPQVLISRTHPGLVKRLFELEVPEIHDGVVEVRSIAREAGNRTKIAVMSNDPNVDPIGACVGTRGARVGNIVDELGGEKIDIIKWSADTAAFVSSALAPADVIAAYVGPDGKSCRVIVPDDQLSLAIGKEGQNARLAAKLTGCKIDIAPASQAGDPPAQPQPAPREEAPADPPAPAEDGAAPAQPVADIDLDAAADAIFGK